MENWFNAYRKWLTVTEEETKKWFFFKEKKITYNDKKYTPEQFVGSALILFEVLRMIENAGYDIAIFYDEVRIEPNLRFKFHVPPIRVAITKADFTDHNFIKLDAVRLAIQVFTEKYLTYVKN